MSKIKIRNLPKNMKISRETMKRLFGGFQLASGDMGLNIFPRFEDTDVRFKSAGPDDSGVQKLNISFQSINSSEQ